MDHVLSVLTHWPPALVYLVTAVVVGAETGTVLGLLVPGEATLLIVGFLCYQGVLRLSVALPLMLGAALVGDSVGYWEGRRGGPRLRGTRLGRRVGERRWAKTERLIQRYGGRAVFLARFIAFARTLTPRLVGMSDLGYRAFLPWDVLGVLGCTGGTVIVGYAAGRSYATAADIFGRATGALLALVLLIVALVLIGRYLGRHPDPVAALVNRLAGWPPLRLVGKAYRAGFRWLSERIGVGGAVAVNVLGGVLALLAIGYGLTWAVDRLVRHSGLPLVDPLIVRWVEAHREPATTSAAVDVLSVLRGPYLIVAVGLAAVALAWGRFRDWRADLVGLIGTGGAIVPLALIAFATDWERHASWAGTWAGPAGLRLSLARPAGLFGNQAVVVTASVGMLAWLLSRRFGWGWAVAAWTAAFGIAVVVAAARVYVGWSWPSEAIASTLLGGLWVLVFVVAWHTRDRLRA
jgi:membrane protein DedA with SNARE-associated domain